MIKPDGDTREAILQAAQRVFARRGTAGARTREIAEEAGVNNALVHYYFGTKAALADQVFERTAGQLIPVIFKVLANPELPLREKVREIAHRQVAFHRQHPWLAGYLLSEANLHPERPRAIIQRFGSPPIEVFRTQITLAIAAGEIREVSAETVMVNLLALCVFPFAARPMLDLLLGLNDERFATFLDDRADQITTFFFAGLQP
jgi:AcrR family transcriptional regulator